jgi:histidinol-phosphate aminotransferase
MIAGVRNAIRLATPYVPGKTVEEVRRELGLQKIVKLGSNENPYGPFPAARRAMSEEIGRLNTYPDVSFREIKSLIGERFGLGPEWVAISHGAEGMLQTLGKVFLEPGDEAILSFATYGLYREISLVMGATLKEILLKDDLSVNLRGMERAITGRAKLLWLNNPNNPTGLLLPKKSVENVIKRLPRGVWLVLDEAYAEFASPAELPSIRELLEAGCNLIVVRTFSKAWGLAGARIGYALARPEMVRIIDTVSEPFNANRIAIAGASASLKSDEAAFNEAIAATVRERQRVAKALHDMGGSVLPSHTNFLFVTFRTESGDVAGKLLRRGVIVRPCGAWGFGSSLRVTVGTPEQNDFFLEALRGVLSGDGEGGA